MNCSDIKNLLSGYLDGYLGENENSLVSEHLKMCSNCSKELELLKETVSLLKIRKPVEPPADFVAQVRNKIEARRWWKEAIKVIFYPLHIKIPAEAIATVVIVCVLYYVYQQPSPVKPGRELIEKALPAIETRKNRDKSYEIPSSSEIEYRQKSQAPILTRSMQAKGAWGFHDKTSPIITEESMYEPETKELLITLKKPKKDLVKIKNYLFILDAKDIIGSTDEETKQGIIIFQIKKKDYLMLTKILIKMDVIKPQEIKEIQEEDIIVRLRIK